MRRYLYILRHYFFQYLKGRLAYQGDFFIAVFTSFSATVASFGFLYILFHRVSSLQGWSFEELLFIYGFSLICLGFFNVLSLNLYEFGERYVMEGRFDQVLLRPLHPLFQVLFEAFRIESFQEVITGSADVAYAGWKLQLRPTAAEVLLFPLMVICGVMIYLSIFVLLTSASFWFEDRIGIVPPVFNMIPFGRYPTTIYNTFLQFLLSWIVPFAFASFYPTTGFLDRGEFRNYFYLVPAVAAAFGALAVGVWNRGVRNYRSTGS
ncbi:MAG: ABC-2 family transporter protein [Acidobacteria bacterium]|nr:ABC-2 family transporter protein [Acidobacteriota bacterium]